MRRAVLASTLVLAACAATNPDPTGIASDPGATPPPTWGSSQEADDTASPADTRDGEGLASSPMGFNPDQGSMTMTMHDAPIDLEAMPVTISGVQARQARTTRQRAV